MSSINRLTLAEADLERLLSMLGLARRARALIIGQDKVLAAKLNKLLVVTSSDPAANVSRKLENREDGSSIYSIEGLSRERLGTAVGLISTQIVAIDHKNGFAKKLEGLLKQGGMA